MSEQKKRTDEMDDEEFLRYLQRGQRKAWIMQAGAGLIVGAVAGVLFNLPANMCFVAASFGFAAVVAAGWLHLTEAKFVTTIAPPDHGDEDDDDNYLPLNLDYWTDEQLERHGIKWPDPQEQSR